jgi:hypothetical protein
MVKAEYKYLGDRLSDTKYRNALCSAVRRTDGKCIRARNGSMLVRWEDGNIGVVIGRLLRKLKT